MVKYFSLGNSDVSGVSPKAADLFGSAFYMELDQFSIISTALAVVSICTELHKIQKDHSCQVKASIIQSLLQVEQKRVLSFSLLQAP